MNYAILINGMMVFAMAFVVAWLATKLLIPLLSRVGCVDVPTARSSHQDPTPRGGGLGIILGLAAAVILAVVLDFQPPSVMLLVGASMVALAGVADDFRGGLSVSLRLVIHCMAAGIVVYHAGGLSRLPLPTPADIPLGTLAIPAGMFWIIAVTNIYNFLDGIDGFAALQGVIVGLAIALLGIDAAGVSVGLAIGGACLGFLLHNWHPAKVFMGDAGATTLGFLVAALPFQRGLDSRGDIVFATAVCMWFFLADGVLTMALRLVRKERLWHAHRCHCYQRLVRTGLRHDQVVLLALVPGAGLAVLGVAAHRADLAGMRWGVLALSLAVFCAYCGWTSLRERRRLRREDPTLIEGPDSDRGRSGGATDRCATGKRDARRPPAKDAEVRRSVSQELHDNPQQSGGR